MSQCMYSWALPRALEASSCCSKYDTTLGALWGNLGLGKVFPAVLNSPSCKEDNGPLGALFPDALDALNEAQRHIGSWLSPMSSHVPNKFF